MLKYQNFSIRTIDTNDNERILLWRNSEKVRINMYTDHVISQLEHSNWFNNALIDKSAVYLIFSHEERPIGFISFTNINSYHSRCHWAFYMGENDAPIGAGSAMEFFALDYAFLTLKIRKLCCEVFTFNTSVVKLHEKFGFVREGLFVGHCFKNHKYQDVLTLAKFGSEWDAERESLMKRIFGKNI